MKQDAYNIMIDIIDIPLLFRNSSMVLSGRILRD